MNKVKKAVGYVCEIPVPGTEMVISKESQLAKMKAFAARENIELVGVVEDNAYTANFMERPGVKKIMKGLTGVDAVLVDRVWCFSRKMSELKPFLEEVEQANAQVISATCLWDCVSQQVRHRYMGALAEKQRAAAREKAAARQDQVAAA
jgi:DNA invertase Pin-like site-specific DNA recombinase